MLYFVIIFGVFMMLPAMMLLAKWLLSFHEELKYLRDEIAKTEGREKRHWIRKRRKLWLSLLPFVKY